jgi:hypothetical protein
MISQSRRDFLTHTGAGFASVALSAMLAEELRGENSAGPVIDAMQPLAERRPHFAPKAKQVIFNTAALRRSTCWTISRS